MKHKLAIIFPLILIFYFLFPPAKPFCQSLPVGFLSLEESYRNSQLLGAKDSTVSFAIRPVQPVQAFGVDNAYDHDGSLAEDGWMEGHGILRYRSGTSLIMDRKFSVAASLQALPIERITQYTSHHPYSLNDGGMIPAVGWQTMTRGGVYGEIGWFAWGPGVRRDDRSGVAKRRGVALTFQLQPEFVSAENLPFESFPEAHRVDIWEKYYEFHSKIDWPERFGEGAYQKLTWGQSSVQIESGPISLGVSNQNLWWGPGMRNSLIMTNTALGFEHFTLNTNRPIKTPIGSFEFQVVSGTLHSSGYSREVPDSTNSGYVHYYSKPKPADSIYLNGVVFTYQPKFLPGLFLGFTRVFLTYYGDRGDTFRDYFPVILPWSKASEGEEQTNADQQNQLASFFGRWLVPGANAEVYFEFGRDDHAWNMRDFFLEPFHSRAYMLGFRKIMPFKNIYAGGLLFAFEHTQLQNASSAQYRSTGPWYLHSQIRQGYTHQGQMLGAGLGPGGNMQTLELTYLISRGKTYRPSGAQLGPDFRRDDRSGSTLGSRGSVGLIVERFVHNNDFHYLAIKDIRKHWVDLDVAVKAQYNFMNFTVFTRLDFITSFNYQHYYEPSEIIDLWWNPGVNTPNFVGVLGLTYRF